MEKELKKVGIIAAMDTEIDALKAAVEDPCVTTIGGIDFVCGKIGNKEVIAAKCGVGKVFAAICTQTMILKFNPDCIINTGVAGGLSEDLDILDCIIAENVVQHDMDTSPIGDPVGLISGINIVDIPTDKHVSGALLKAATACSVKARYGKVATGDQFVAYDSQREKIIENFSADCCEMEGGSIGQVCYVNRVPFGIIRTISDNYKSDASMAFPVFADKAAKFASQAVMEFLKLI